LFMALLKKATLAEQAYEVLKDQIISGARPAGQRLLAEDLANELAISQTPVKEALVFLERDGLVEGEARRGSVVRRFTLDDITEIYEARMMLEIHALEAGIRGGRVTAEFIESIQDIFANMMSAMKTGTARGISKAVELDRLFHERLVSLANNALISHWHQTVIRQLQTANNYSAATYTLDRAGPGHEAIIDGFRSDDLNRALNALRIHLIGSRDEMLARAPEDRPIRDD